MAVSVAVSPAGPSPSESNESLIEAASCSTETDALADAEPEVAVIVAVPYAAAVTRPVEDTVATGVLDELHDTLAPLIVAPFWSLTVAESCCVAPTDEKLKLVADSVIDVANDGAPCNFPVVGLSHAASKSTAESLM